MVFLKPICTVINLEVKTTQCYCQHAQVKHLHNGANPLKPKILFALTESLFFQRVRSNTAYVLESYRCKLSFLFGFNDLALKTKVID